MLIPQEVFEAFARLEDHPDFTRIRSWIEDQRKDAVEALSRAEDLRQLGRAQGQYEFTDQFLRTCAKARAILQSNRASGQHLF